MEMLSILSGILFLLAFVPYIRAILRGQTKPSKASWLVWAGVDAIILVAMYKATGKINGQILGAVTGASSVVLLSFRYGEKGWTKLDKLCLSGAVLGIALWQVFSSPILGLVISNLVILLGSVPTFVSAYRNPEKEDRLAWSIFWLSCVFALIAVPRWTLGDAIQPVTFMIVESAMVYLLFVQPQVTRVMDDRRHTREVMKGLRELADLPDDP